MPQSPHARSSAPPHTLRDAQVNKWIGPGKTIPILTFVRGYLPARAYLRRKSRRLHASLTPASTHAEMQFFGLFSFVMTFVETFGAAVAVRFRTSHVLISLWLVR